MALLLLACGAGLPAARAQSHPAQRGFYINLGGALELRDPAKDPAGETTFNPGFLLSGAAGIRLGQLRFEAEYNILDNNNDTLRISAYPPPNNRPLPATGDISISTYFANAAYDFDVSGTPVAFAGTPFLSLGVGAMQSQIHSLANTVSAVGGAFIVNSTSNFIPGGQIKIGTAIPVSPGIAFVMDYRYMRGLEKLSFLIQDGSTVHPDAAFNIIEAGIRLSF